MPRIPRQALNIRTEFSGPRRSPARDQALRLVKHIEINPEIQQLLEKPTWSVTSLMPPSALQSKTSSPAERGGQRKDESSAVTASKSAALQDTAAPEGEEEITVGKLHHLLRLSALPIPKSHEQTQRMLQSLRDQLHFVREIQKVDTQGVEPLVALRDETAEARQERTITKDSLAAFIEREEKRGKNGTIRRVKDERSAAEQRGQDQLSDPFALGESPDSRRMGRYFFVKKKQKASVTGTLKRDPQGHQQPRQRTETGTNPMRREQCDDELRTEAEA